ncbi:MAG: YceI family protein [Crocinitomicaceae bacterium]
MKRKLFLGASIVTLLLGTVSCGGSEETTEDTDVTDSTAIEDVVEATTYEVDTAASVINWYNVSDGEKGHYGYVKLLDGSYTAEGEKVTAASLTVNMNTITVTDEMGGDKLQGHLMSPDFFDVNQYASASFNFDRHEDGVIYGTVNVAGVELPVEAPVTVKEGSVEADDFKVNMVDLPFFQQERSEAPEKEWHDPLIGFTATIVAK